MANSAARRAIPFSTPGTSARHSKMDGQVNRMIAITLACAAAACGGSESSSSVDNKPPATSNVLQLTASAKFGKILTDGNGRTLYLFSMDLPAGGGKAPVSNCTGSCLGLWPLFSGANPQAGAGITATDVGTFVRADGASQATYKGYPIYYFADDGKAGDVNGESISDWFVLRDPFYTVMTLDNGTPRLTGGKGRSVYYFVNDTVGTPPVSNCAGTAGDRGTCIGNWPPFFAGESIVAPTGIDPARFTTFTRADGSKQTVFNGHLLYYFADDAVPGDVKGLAFAPGKWFNLNPLASTASSSQYP
jgi:predicted lipoprotein with Yx(FWY)xxD motif